MKPSGSHWQISLRSWICYGELWARLKLGLSYSVIILGAVCTLRLPASRNKSWTLPAASVLSQWVSGRGGLILFFSGQFQGKECDGLKGSSCRLTLQELQGYGDGLHLLGAGGRWHPIPVPIAGEKMTPGELKQWALGLRIVCNVLLYELEH